jgi:hypothetical protein
MPRHDDSEAIFVEFKRLIDRFGSLINSLNRNSSRALAARDYVSLKRLINQTRRLELIRSRIEGLRKDTNKVLRQGPTGGTQSGTVARKTKNRQRTNGLKRAPEMGLNVQKNPVARLQGDHLTNSPRGRYAGAAIRESVIPLIQERMG